MGCMVVEEVSTRYCCTQKGSHALVHGGDIEPLEEGVDQMTSGPFWPRGPLIIWF